MDNLQPIHKIKIARKLLQLGNPIVDIQRDKHNSDRTVFFFTRSNKFLQDYKYVKEENM